MARLTITLIASILLFAFESMALNNNFQDIGKDSVNVVDSLGRKQGHWTFSGKDIPNSGVPAENLLEEGEYQNDLRTGTWTRYLADGRIAAVMQYSPDIQKKTSVRTCFYYYSYHPNGKLKKKPSIGECPSAADFISYDENGELVEAENFDANCNTTYKLQHIEKGELDSIEVFRLNASFKENPDLSPQTTKKLIDLDETGEYCVDYDHQLFQIGTFLNGELMEGREIEVDDMMRPVKVRYYRGGIIVKALSK